ncbi:insulin receptor substrate 1-B [Lates japonicus]|uniref:Insulin receptor substrate 1-B n=1 Tax=Lates japonicus TaxID=270547 RepID=A0AAD3QWG0_LATJO|nr:insulin receptor substrate 1-B [Lates japonicus]
MPRLLLGPATPHRALAVAPLRPDMNQHLTPLWQQRASAVQNKSKDGSNANRCLPHMDNKGSDPSIFSKICHHSGQPSSMEQETGLVSPVKSFQSGGQQTDWSRYEQPSHRHGLDCSLWENRQATSLSATATSLHLIHLNKALTTLCDLAIERPSSWSGRLCRLQRPEEALWVAVLAQPEHICSIEFL